MPTPASACSTFPPTPAVTTPAGTATTPSGLGKLNAWVDSEIDNTAKRFYGGDLLGNLWRFDTDNLVAPNQAALRLAYFSAGGVPQPITTQPSLAQVNYGGSHYRGGLCRHRQVHRYHRPGQHRHAIGLCDQGSADQHTAG